MIADAVHKLLVAGVLVLPILFLTGVVLRHPALRLCTAIAVATVVAMLPFPSDCWVFPALAGALWPLSAGLAVGLAYEYTTILRSKPPVAARDHRLFAWLVIALGVLLYPAALGAHLPDLYALGYSGWTVPAAMAAMLVAGLLAGSSLTVAWVALAAVWTLAGIAPGPNLWDSLIDPVNFIGAIAWQVRAGVVALSRRRGSAG